MARRQFQSLLDVVYAGPVTVDIGNAATGNGTFGTGTVTVSGAAVGDAVLVFPRTAYTAGAPVVGDVSAANTVRLTVLNNSAGAVDYASQVYDIVVFRKIF
jgi:hypothetical protein